MIEMDPRYVDVAIKRFQQLGGEESVHDETGLRFADLRIWREIEGGDDASDSELEKETADV